MNIRRAQEKDIPRLIELLEQLFEYVKNEAKQLGCYEVTLNVWSGNTSAEKFYEKMGLKTKERQMEYILM